MKTFIQGMYQKKNFIRRLFAVLAAVITMGFALSWLILVAWGTDPCSSLNIAVAAKLGTSLGNWQALLNCILFIPVLLWGREYIGFGTLANMFLVGYAVDFFSWLWTFVVPEGTFDALGVKIAVLIPALAIFVLAVGVYTAVELGTAPYDAIPLMIAKAQGRFPFRVVRMGFDIAVIAAALFFGANIGIVTILMAFTLGPVIALVVERLGAFLGVE